MIQVETTPNPNSLKFISEKQISSIGTQEFQKVNIEKIHNIFIKNLLHLEGVELVLVSDNFLSETFTLSFAIKLCEMLRDENIKVNSSNLRLNKSNIRKILEGSEIVLDCTDNFETRKCVFDSKILKTSDLEKSLNNSVEFELLWLKNKKNFLKEFCKEDQERIKMLEARVSS